MSSVAINDCYIEDLSLKLRSSVQKSKRKIVLYNFSFTYLYSHPLNPPHFLTQNKHIHNRLKLYRIK